jgi:hypothetical protein
VKELDARKNPPDRELACKCGKRILMWDTDKRIAHEEPECSFFTSICESLTGHENEGKVVVIEEGS